MQRSAPTGTLPSSSGLRQRGRKQESRPARRSGPSAVGSELQHSSQHALVVCGTSRANAFTQTGSVRSIGIFTVGIFTIFANTEFNSGQLPDTKKVGEFIGP